MWQGLLFLKLFFSQRVKNTTRSIAEMKAIFTFVSVKVAHSLECLTGYKTLVNPFGDGRRHLIRKGFVFLRFKETDPEVSQTSDIHRLGQVNSLLDNSKPSGQVFVFEGDFFFCFLFSKVLNTFFLPLFSFSDKPIQLPIYE